MCISSRFLLHRQCVYTWTSMIPCTSWTPENVQHVSCKYAYSCIYGKLLYSKVFCIPLPQLIVIPTNYYSVYIASVNWTTCLRADTSRVYQLCGSSSYTSFQLCIYIYIYIYIYMCIYISLFVYYRLLNPLSPNLNSMSI